MSKDKMLNESKYIGYSLINDRELSNMIKTIEGKMLTIVDASISDKEQREAVKSLVRNDIWHEFQRLPMSSPDISLEKSRELCGNNGEFATVNIVK